MNSAGALCYWLPPLVFAKELNAPVLHRERETFLSGLVLITNPQKILTKTNVTHDDKISRYRFL